MSNGDRNPIVRAVTESSVWRSLFRQPYPTTSRTRALAVMNNVFLHLHPVRVKRHAVRYTYTFCLGGISFFLFLALTVTGLYLMFFYVPSVTRAYQDIQAIEVAVASDQLDKVIGTITSAAKTGQIGDGKIFVFSLDHAVRIRTGETDAAAL